MDYYETTDPAARKKLLAEDAGSIADWILKEEPEGNADNARKAAETLFVCRHPRQRQLALADLYLQNFFALIRVSRDNSGRRGRGPGTGQMRQLKDILDSFGFGRVHAFGREGETAIYWEIRNGVRRFLRVGEDASYGTRFMGMIRLKDEQREQHLAEDIWRMQDGLSLLCQGLKLEMLTAPAALAGRAIEDEYIEHDEGAAERLRHISLVMKAGG